MTAARRALPIVLAAAAIAAVVVLAERAGRGSGARPPVPLQASTSLSARTRLFGEPLVARVAIVLDPARVDPRTLRVSVDFSPFRVARRPSVESVHDGAATTVRYTYRLECLAPACAPRVPERTFAFAPAVVRYAGGEGRVLWPSFTVASRLTETDLASRALRLPEATPRSYWLSSRAVGWGLTALAALLLIGAGVAAARLLAAGRSGAPAPMSTVERALAQVLHASSHAIEERRTALDRLALALDELGVRPLATATRRLAWGRPEPETAAMTELVATVKERDA